MNEQAIDNLKAGMNDRVARCFDPLKKTHANIEITRLLSNLENTSNAITIANVWLWVCDVYDTGNIACNLNIILQNQNLALLAKVEKLEEENKKLKQSDEWK